MADGTTPSFYHCCFRLSFSFVIAICNCIFLHVAPVSIRGAFCCGVIDIYDNEGVCWLEDLPAYLTAVWHALFSCVVDWRPVLASPTVLHLALLVLPPYPTIYLILPTLGTIFVGFISWVAMNITLIMTIEVIFLMFFRFRFLLSLLVVVMEGNGRWLFCRGQILFAACCFAWIIIVCGILAG